VKEAPGEKNFLDTTPPCKLGGAMRGAGGKPIRIKRPIEKSAPMEGNDWENPTRCFFSSGPRSKKEPGTSSSELRMRSAWGETERGRQEIVAVEDFIRSGKTSSKDGICRMGKDARDKLASLRPNGHA